MNGAALTVQLSASAVADGTGRAVVEFRGPGVTYERIDVSAIQLSASSALLPTARLYRGSSNLGTLLAVELDGNTGAFLGGLAGDSLTGSEVFAIEWTGATPGAVLTAVLTGIQTRV